MLNVRCSQVGLILLAAGESRRLGTPKQLIKYNGQSLIRHAAQVAIASAGEPIVVVLGAYSDRIAPELDNLPVQICHNSQWRQGMSSSIAAGVQAIAKNNIDGVIVALVDQPLIDDKIYNQLIKRYQQSNHCAIASIYNQTLGVPALFDRILFAELANIKGKGGAKQLLKRYSLSKFNLLVPAAAIDLDTPEDLTYWRSLEPKLRLNPRHD